MYYMELDLINIMDLKVLNKRIIETTKELEQLSQTPEATKKNLIKITGKTLKLRYEIYLENGGKEKVENRKKGKYNTR